MPACMRAYRYIRRRGLAPTNLRFTLSSLSLSFVALVNYAESTLDRPPRRKGHVSHPLWRRRPLCVGARNEFTSNVLCDLNFVAPQIAWQIAFAAPPTTRKQPGGFYVERTARDYRVRAFLVAFCGLLRWRTVLLYFCWKFKLIPEN